MSSHEEGAAGPAARRAWRGDLEDLHEVCAYGSPLRLKALAEGCLEDAEVEALSGPEPVLLMLRARETVEDDTFNLGEVLVTRCELVLDGEPGWGMVLGDDPERALCAAVLDAAYWRGMPEAAQDELGLQLAFVRETRRRRWAEVQPTRVEFGVTPP